MSLSCGGSARVPHRPKLVDHLYRELTATKRFIVEDLIKDINYQPTMISGKCGFCGAPYHEKP